MPSGTNENRGIGGVTFGHAGVFWLGVVLVTAGVAAHLPMYLMGRDMGYRLAGMPMGLGM
jgi:putative MFS transporter